MRWSRLCESPPIVRDIVVVKVVVIMLVMILGIPIIYRVCLGLPIDSHLRDSLVEGSKRIMGDGDLVEKFAHTRATIILGDEVRKLRAKVGEDVDLPHLHLRLDRLGRV